MERNEFRPFPPVRMRQRVRSSSLINAWVHNGLRPPSLKFHRSLWFRKSAQSENGSIACW